MPTVSSYLILARSSPYANQQARAALDIAFTAAAFEQEVSFVFMDDGVLQLLDQQDTHSSLVKNIGKMIPALKLYDVKSVYAHEPSLITADLPRTQLSEDVELVDNEELKNLIAQADQVLIF